MATDESTAPGSTQWIVPAVLIAIAVVAVIVIGVVVAGASDDEPSSPVAQLEDWTRCLRDAQVPVPLVEALDDGGVRITFDRVRDEGRIDREILEGARERCGDEAPERIREVTSRIERLAEWFEDR